MTTFVLSQIVVAISFAFGIAAFQFRERVSILRCWVVSASLNAVHFFILGRFDIGLLVVVAALRYLTASYTTDRRYMYLFMAIAPIGFAFTYQSPVSVLALISGLLGTYGSFRPKDLTVRIIMLGCALLWTIHNSLIGSWVAAIMEASYLVSNVVGWWRFYFRKSLPVAE